MRSTQHALSAGTRSSMVAILDQRVAEALDLQSQAKHAHWNAKGPSFYALHLLYDSLAGTLGAHADALAERVVSLGGTVHGTLRMTSKATTLPDAQGDAHAAMDHVEALVSSFALHARSMSDSAAQADAAGDRGTADLLTGQVRELDKGLFLLEAHLVGGPLP